MRKAVLLPGLILLLTSLVACQSMGRNRADEVTTLAQFQVYPIAVNHPFEPSGLTFKGDQLLTVCDDSKNVYAISFLDNGEVSAAPIARVQTDQLGVAELDLEGITIVDQDIFVVSEVHHKMVRLRGDQSDWVPQSKGVYESAYQAGLFQVHNAGMEAIAYLGDQTFLLSVERQPRGLIQVQFDQEFKHILSQTNQVFDDSKYPIMATRKPDLTGFYYLDGTLFALHRNAYMIHELVKDAKGVYQEGRAWSYENIVKNPAYAYQDMEFGHAEGLAVDQDHFYLVLDNNNSPKLNNPNDKRPLLIKAKRH